MPIHRILNTIGSRKEDLVAFHEELQPRLTAPYVLVAGISDELFPSTRKRTVPAPPAPGGIRSTEQTGLLAARVGSWRWGSLPH